MSDMDLEQGLQEVANAMRDDGSQKRKRDSESADDTRRGSNKRISPNNAGKDQQDVEALQDYNNLHHQGQLDNHNGTNEHASTAAAALAGIYPSMTVPQATDVSFAATQDSDGGRNDSFMDNSQNDGFPNYQQDSMERSRSKPAVGSDEWHKVRKDNHKEGKMGPILAPFRACANREQLNVGAERLSMRASTS